MKRTRVMVVTNLGIDQMWETIERSITFKFFMITLQCGLFTMTIFLDIIFKCIDNFLKIMEAIVVHDSYFVQKRDATGLLGFSSIHKCIVAIRMLAYDVVANYIDEYCRLSKSIAFECLKFFVKVIRTCFESNYFKQPTLAKSQEMNENQRRKKISKHVCFNSLYAMVLEKLPSGMARLVSRQRQDKKDHL